MKPKWSFV